MELFHQYVDSKPFLCSYWTATQAFLAGKNPFCVQIGLLQLGTVLRTVESNFSMPGKFLLESGRRAHARSPYEMPAQWQKVKAWYQEILWKCFKTNFLKALCSLGRHRFILLGKPSNNLYDSFPIKGNIFNTLPCKKHGSRVSCRWWELFLCLFNPWLFCWT